MNKTKEFFLRSRWGTRHIAYGIMLYIPMYIVLLTLNKYMLKEIFSADNLAITSAIISVFIRGILPMCRFYFFEEHIELRFLFFGRKKIHLKDIKYIEFYSKIPDGYYCRIYTQEKKWIQKLINYFVYVIELKSYSLNKGGQCYTLLLSYFEKNVKIKIHCVYSFYKTENNDLKRICQIDKDGFLINKNEL